jgi:hypothetical protein
MSEILKEESAKTKTLFADCKSMVNKNNRISKSAKFQILLILILAGGKKIIFLLVIV